MLACTIKKLFFGLPASAFYFSEWALPHLGSVKHGLEEKYFLDEIASGTLFSILPFGILSGSLLFGPFCDKYGYRILLSSPASACLLALKELHIHHPRFIKSEYFFIWIGWRRNQWCNKRFGF